MIQVLFFAQLREQLGCEGLKLEPEGLASVAQVREALLIRHPEWRSALGRDSLLLAVNQTLAKAEQPVRDGDEVAFMPPVTGG